MVDIFDTNNLYPDYDSPLKQHFNNVFDTVFISFSPFFKIMGNNKEQIEVSSTKIISLEELQEEDHIFQNLKPNNKRVIYTNDNPNYASDNEIIEKGFPVRWQYILENTDLNTSSEISQALRTSIGALKKEYETLQLKEILEHFTIENKIYHPIEGRITLLSLIEIYKCLTYLQKTEITMSDEFFQDVETIEISTLSISEFVLRVRGYMYLYPTDRSLLFTIEWDSFFFLMCGDRKSLDHITFKFDFEGFYTDENTMHSWDLL